MKISCTKCVHCQRDIRNNNYTRHIEKCGKPVIKAEPIARIAWNKGKTKENDIRVAKNALGVKNSHVDRIPSGCCAWDKETRSIKAKRQGFGGYRENAGRSKKFKVFDYYGNKTTLQSTYELAVFEILCELGIEWTRPKSLKYDGKNYFADFYLPTYNIWLDPKNSFKAKQDEEKIRKVREQNGVEVYVILQHQIKKEYIASLIQK